MEYRQGRGARIANLFATASGIAVLAVGAPLLAMIALGLLTFATDPPAWLAWAVGITAAVVPLALGARMLRISAPDTLVLHDDHLALGRFQPYRVAYADITALRRGDAPVEGGPQPKKRRWIEFETPDLVRRFYLGDDTRACFDELRSRCPRAVRRGEAAAGEPEVETSLFADALRRAHCRRNGRCALTLAVLCSLAAASPFLTGGLPTGVLVGLVVVAAGSLALGVLEYRRARRRPDIARG